MNIRKETLLVVEDELMLLDLLKSLFEDEGYTVIAAKDGEEAVKIFRAQGNAIALVMTDMGLPKLGGWEVFQKLREMNPGVKVILASGFVDAAVKEDLMNRGAADVFQKPYVPQMILDRIREILDVG
jgi:two-component system, cell cycle sensor histidine kinase and response regulator CckA